MMDRLEKLKDKFVEDCAKWYKMWSSWLAVLWGMVVTVFWNDPTLLGELVNGLPEETRAYLSPVIFAIISALPIIVRLLKQQSLVKAIENKID
jgi:hypothetical protein